ncbi:MAG: hypothetical protein AAFX87_08745 [Bacteroidota bacterium]
MSKQGKDMKQKMKLDDIEKKQIYEVPDGYFDKLPGIIQARVTEKQTSRVGMPKLGYGLRLAIPIIVAIAIAVYVFLNSNSVGEPTDIEGLISQVSTEELIEYIQLSDISTDELIEEIGDEIDWTLGTEEDIDLQLIDEDISEEELEELLDDHDLSGEYF